MHPRLIVKCALCIPSSIRQSPENTGVAAVRVQSPGGGVDGGGGADAAGCVAVAVAGVGGGGAVAGEGVVGVGLGVAGCLVYV